MPLTPVRAMLPLPPPTPPTPAEVQSMLDSVLMFWIGVADAVAAITSHAAAAAKTPYLRAIIPLRA
jgi:hypothetical protein